jgi:hypothetical protein
MLHKLLLAVPGGLLIGVILTLSLISKKPLDDVEATRALAVRFCVAGAIIYLVA